MPSVIPSTKAIPFSHQQYGMWYIEEDFRDAAYRGDLKRMQTIIKQHPKLDINAVNEYGETALYIACKKNQNVVATFLLEQANININVQTILGNSPMLVAAWNDKTELVIKLLEKGADASLKTNANRQYHGGVSALDVAKERDNKDLVNVLEQHLGKEITLQPKP